LKKRTREVIKGDKAISIEVFHAVLKFHEQVWRDSRGSPQAVRAALAGACYSCSWCTALRGEEVPLIELVGTQNSMEQLKSTHLPTHFTLTISGRTKLNRASGATFKIPCTTTTEGMGLEPGKWLACHLALTIRAGRTEGYLFSQWDGKRSYLSDFEENFFWSLEELQAEVCVHLPPEWNLR
jgi:hypothetical protein